jgi:hypothetical protein
MAKGWLRFDCPGCGTEILVSACLAGMVTACRRCTRDLSIPAVASLSAALAARRLDRRGSTRFKLRDGWVKLSRSACAEVHRDSETTLIATLSCTGVGFSIPPRTLRSRRLEVGERIVLVLSLPAFAEPIELLARVVRVRSQANSDHSSFGCRFVGLGGDASRRLRKIADNVCLQGVGGRAGTGEMRFGQKSGRALWHCAGCDAEGGRELSPPAAWRGLGDLAFCSECRREVAAGEAHARELPSRIEQHQPADARRAV